MSATDSAVSDSKGALIQSIAIVRESPS
ncbi:MAG: hypothetical protein QOH50_4046, partial [Kribbellaceae bacterium]|nr:hypothetical protein [Kribbellaceae bacterium]